MISLELCRKKNACRHKDGNNENKVQYMILCSEHPMFKDLLHRLCPLDSAWMTTLACDGRMFEQAGTDRSRKQQSSPSPTRCSEMALRHSLTPALEGHTCHIWTLRREVLKATKADAELTCYHFKAQQCRIQMDWACNRQSLRCFKQSRPITFSAIAHKQNGPSLFPQEKRPATAGWECTTLLLRHQLQFQRETHTTCYF